MKPCNDIATADSPSPSHDLSMAPWYEHRAGSRLLRLAGHVRGQQRASQRPTTVLHLLVHQAAIPLSSTSLALHLHIISPSTFLFVFGALAHCSN